MTSRQVSSVDSNPCSEVAGRQKHVRYEHLDIRDYARVHLGDTHVEQQHFHSYPANEDDEEKRQKQQDRLIQDLGFNMMETRLSTITAAHADTCRWLLTNRNYLRWRDPRLQSSHHGLLWIKGKPGAGKSTLMKYSLEHMQSLKRDNSTILSFFFNARGHGLEKTTEGMYRSILHQLWTQLPERFPQPIPRYSKEWIADGWPLEVLQDWLRVVILHHGVERRFIFYVDALDECEEEAIRQAIGYFEALGELARTRGIDFTVCFASRHYPNITVRHKETVNLDIEKEHQKDIAVFVRTRLRGERTTRHEIGRAISQRCSGVFLWAALVVQIVNERIDHGATHSQLLAELSRVPSGIEALLRSMVRDNDSGVLLLLQLVLFSVRPLTVAELYCAMHTSIDDPVLDELMLQSTTDDQMRSSILTMSRGLVEFTQSKRLTNVSDSERNHYRDARGPAGAQFIHETVREHLLNGGLVALDLSLLGHAEAASHAKLGKLCRNHIETLISFNPRKHPFLMYSLKNMLTHMEHAYSGKAVGLRCIDAIPQSIWLAIRRYIDKDDDETHAPTPLYVMVRARCEELAAAFIQRQLAAHRRQRRTTKSTSLDDHSVDINAICGTRWYSSVLIAALDPLDQCSMQLVELVLDCWADPNLAIEPGYTPIAAALYTQGDELRYQPVKLLLQHGADPNFPMWSSREQTPLAVAVKLGSQQLVELFLAFGARPGGERIARPLCLAVVWCPPSVVRALLAAGARVNDRNEHGRTALHEVIMRKGRRTRDVRVAIARMLLDAGANVEAMDDRADSPVTLAFSQGRVGLVKLFFDRGADPNVAHHSEIFRRLRVPGNDYSADHLMMSDSSDDDLAVKVS